VLPGSGWISRSLGGLDECRRSVVERGSAKRIPIPQIKRTKLGPAYVCRVRQYGLKNRFKLPWRTADDIEHLGRCSLLLKRLVQPVLERNPVGCIDAGRLALMSDLRRRAGPYCPATLCFCRFAARFVAPSHCLPRGSQHIVAVQMRLVKAPPDVRFGSKADMCSAKGHVRFTPKCDIDCVHSNVHYGPKADMALVDFKSPDDALPPPTQIVECIQGRTNLLTDFGLWIDVLKSVNQRGIFGTQFFSQFVHSLKQRIELLGIPRLVSLLDLMTEPGHLAINSDLRFVSADDFENLLRVSLGHIRRGRGLSLHRWRGEDHKSCNNDPQVSVMPLPTVIPDPKKVTK